MSEISDAEALEVFTPRGCDYAVQGLLESVTCCLSDGASPILCYGATAAQANVTTARNFYGLFWLLAAKASGVQTHLMSLVASVATFLGDKLSMCTAIGSLLWM